MKDKNVEKLLEKRYYLKDSNENLIEHSWSDVAKRVADNIALAEEEKNRDYYRKRFYDKIKNMEFIPSSPCLFNAGTTSQSLSSCFVVDIEDNIEGIFQTVAECAKIFQMSGGAGFSMRKIRPKGSICKSSGSFASGVVSFLYIFDEVVNRVKQGNKRNGALKIDLPCDHPEIFDFIHAKDNTNDLKNMNISVSITDEFIKAIEENKNWDLKFNGIVYKTIKAVDLWNEIMQSAWATGEPGISYQTNMNNGNMNPHLNEETFGNPCHEYVNIPYSSCLTGDTKILLKEGVRCIEDMINTSGYILSENNIFRKYDNIVSKGIKQVYEIKLKNGLSIKSTNDHKYFTTKGLLELKDLNVGDKLLTSSQYPLTIEENYNSEYEMYGWMHGDGWYSSTVGCSFNAKDGDFIAKEKLLPIFHSVFNTGHIKPLKNDDISYQIQTNNKYALNKCEELGFIKGFACDKQIPKNFYKWTLIQQISFMRGLFSADGFIFGRSKRDIALASTSLILLKSVQEFMESIGIQCRINTTIFKTEKRKPQHKLIISGESSETYMKVIGFISENKNEKYNSINTIRKKRSDKKSYEIISILPVGEFEVFDIVEVNKTNNFFANGLLVHNCNLASINLVKVVKNGKIDWDKLKENIQLTFRFLDNMITMNKLPLQKIEEMTKNIRPIGLGTMGFAQLLYMLKIPYDSQECLDFIDELYGFIQKTALEYNIQLAKERGVYPAWEGSEWEKEEIKVRCSSMTSIAPNGSIAFIAKTSGGIEPVWALGTLRIDNDGDEYFIFDPIFENYLKTNNLYTKEILNKINNNNGTIQGLDDIFSKEIQKIFVTANNIPSEWHVKVLSKIQNYVDLSISKTVNLPNNATVKNVGDIYLMAGKQGIKGITVYRDGSRENQILSTTNTPKKKVKDNQERGHVIQAPEEADGRTYKFKSGCGNVYITINWNDEGELNQTFTNKGSSGTCKSNQEAVSRLISLSLRGGIPIDKIIDQLESVDICSSYTNARAKGKKVSKGASCPHAIANILKKAVKDVENKFNNINIKIEKEEDVEENNKRLCPECKEQLINEGNCIQCKSCGWSKCG